MTFLSSTDTTYSSPGTLNLGINIAIGYYTTVNSYPREKYIGNITNLNLFPAAAGKYHPTKEEESLYFLLQNGLKTLRRSSIDACDYYAMDA